MELTLLSLCAQVSTPTNFNKYQPTENLKMSKEIDVVKTDLLKAFLRTIEFSKFVISKQYCLVPDDLDPWVKMLSAMEAVESLTA